MTPLPHAIAFEPTDDVVPPDAALAIVVGAHPRAEAAHRGLAYGLAAVCLDRIAEHWPESNLRPAVCADLWHLNDDAWRLRPTIAIGDPEANATTAFLASRLEPALVFDDRYRIHVDLEQAELRACIWGADAATTALAVEQFVDRYLDDFLSAATAG